MATKTPASSRTGAAKPKPGAAAAALKPGESKTSDTRERILEAAVDLLRRHGPAKMTVVDVARALEMSHANVYRHFASKAALHDAVAEGWLKTVTEPLQAIVDESGDAAERLERWVLTLAELKRRKVLSDPELFATYHAIVAAVRNVIDEHLAELHRQVSAIIRDGVAQGTFKVADPEAAARAVLGATIRFHHPHHVREAGGRDDAAEIKGLMRLLLAGLRAGEL